jgi:L-asparagine oxygenase
MSARTTVCKLSNLEKEQVKNIVAEHILEYGAGNYEEFIESCRIAVKFLPRCILDWAVAVRQTSIGLISNLPIDDVIPQTPLVRFSVDNQSMFSDRVVGLLSVLFGKPYTFDGKTVARHITNLYPIREHRNTQMASSDTELEWHVEDAFHTARPNWIALLCIKEDKNAFTKIARAVDLELPQNTLALLKKKNFQVLADDTYDDMTQTALTWIIRGPNTNREIVFDPPYTICKDDKERAILSLLKEAAEKSKQTFALEKGDFIIFNNRKAIHARSEYSPKYDGNDRWLKRALILSDAKWLPFLHDGIMKVTNNYQ